MTRVLRRGFVFALIGSVSVAACANGGDTTGDHGAADGGSTNDAGSVAESGGGSNDSGMCMLGSINDCGACGKACATTDPKTALPTCSDATMTATCDIKCTGEHYDLDGKADNGCETDDLPIQDTATTAVVVTLPDATAKNLVAPLYGDKRAHDTDVAARALGREDWYVVTASGAAAGGGMTACLSAGNFPSDNVLEVCITQSGSTTFDAPGCKTYTVANDAGSSCVNPNGMAGNDLGTFYVRVRRTAGTSNANQYALYLRH